MELPAYKLLEAGTQRSLHAAGFSRCSGHASAVLTDLLARYIQLLASTAARYADHAGRTSLTSTDALEALDDLGFGLQDLIDYVPEAKELSRYAVYSARRVEELHEFKAHLGRNIRDDAFPLTYAQYDGDEEDEEELDEEDAEEDEAPPQKRQRTLDWDGHIPSFLPPFPLVEDVPESPRAESPQPLMPPPPPSTSNAAPLGPQLTATSTSAADYVLQVPYDASSLADVSQWHLPGPPPRPPPPSQTPSASSKTPGVGTSTSASGSGSGSGPGTLGSGPNAPTLNPQLALLKAFHHILKNPTREPAAPTPARHRVALGLLTHSALVPRWEVPDSMYASSAPSAPRAWPIVPTFAVPSSSKHADAEDVPQRRFPSTTRTVAAPERIAPLIGAQGSRLPELSRRVLPPSVYTRVTKLGHPPPLSRLKNVSSSYLKYGQGVPAPWNAPPSAASAEDADGKDGKGEPGRIPDARVYATWEYEVKDFRAPLNPRRGRGAQGAQGHAGTSTPAPTRRSSRAVV